MIGKIKQNYKYYILVILILMINTAYFFGINSINNLKKILVILVLIIVKLILAFLIYKFDAKKMKIENQFLVIFLIFGILFLVAIPISKIPDELTHFLRTYEISKGHVFSQVDKKTKNGGRVLPTNLKKVNVKNYKQELKVFEIKENSKKEFIPFSNTALYSPICYIPQIIGMSIGNLLNTSLIIKAYLGRIVNFIVFMAIMYFSIKYIPFKKNLLFFISLLPITIQEAVSLAPDALTIASVSALISFVLYMKYTKNGLMSKKEKIIMIILPIIIAMCKIVYLPVCLLLFMIPKERFKSNKNKIVSISILALIVIILNLMWTAKVSIYLQAGMHGSNSSEQIKFILTHPIKYVAILFKTFELYGDFHIFNMMGRQLSYMDVYVYAPYIYISILILISLLFIRDNDVKKIEKKYIFLMIFIILSILLLIYTSIYIQWSSYKLDYVDGVQGRYYIPILLLVGLILSNLFNIKSKENLFNKYVILVICFENICALVGLVSHFM